VYWLSPRAQQRAKRSKNDLTPQQKSKIRSQTLDITFAELSEKTFLFMLEADKALAKGDRAELADTAETFLGFLHPLFPTLKSLIPQKKGNADSRFDSIRDLLAVNMEVLIASVLW
jgi:hypothetical protein